MRGDGHVPLVHTRLPGGRACVQQGGTCVSRVGRGAGAPGARGAKVERPGAGRGALQKKAGRSLEV